nr:hypothetical protein [Tanacetum cinerariifolium]
VPAKVSIAPVDPLVASKADSESEPAEQRPKRHESLAPSFEFPLTLVVSPPKIHRWPAILVRPDEAIPFGQPYRTYPIGRVNFTSDSSSSGSSLDSSLDISLGSSSDSLSDSLSVHSSRCDASESSLDSSSERSLYSSSPSAGPSCKRCRSSTTLVSGEEHMKISTADIDTVADLGTSEGVGAPTEAGIGMGVKVATSDIKEDDEEFEAEASAGGTMEIAIDPLATGGISESTGGDASDLGGTLYDIAHYIDRARLADKVRSLGQENLRVRALLCIERDRVDSLRRHMAPSQEEFCQIHRDRDDTQRRLRRRHSGMSVSDCFTS